MEANVVVFLQSHGYAEIVEAWMMNHSYTEYIANGGSFSNRIWDLVTFILEADLKNG